MAGGEQRDLLLNLADVVVATFEVDVLDCYAFARAFAEGAVDDSKRATYEIDMSEHMLYGH